MRILRPVVLALTVTLMVSSTVSAGNIGGLRTTGNIGGTRSAGNIGGTRAAGNIGGTRSAGIAPQSTVSNLDSARFNLESTLSGLIRMLLESGALL